MNGLVNYSLLRLWLLQSRLEIGILQVEQMSSSLPVPYCTTMCKPPRLAIAPPLPSPPLPSPPLPSPPRYLLLTVPTGTYYLLPNT